MKASIMKSLIAVVLLAALGGCATGGYTSGPSEPASSGGEAEG